MSVARMRILLGLDTVGSTTNTAQRQQITPDIKFTCDGMITKWIVGADWVGRDSFYPELQVWRNIGNDVYQKRNGTFITIPSVSSNRIYEYDNFSPIPFQAGDILGVFLPRNRDTRLRLLSETKDSPTNYYLNTANSASESPFDTIDIQSTQSLRSQAYHPLVSVEIGKIEYNNHFKSCCCVVKLSALILIVQISSYLQLKTVLQVLHHHLWYDSLNTYNGVSYIHELYLFMHLNLSLWYSTDYTCIFFHPANHFIRGDTD